MNACKIQLIQEHNKNKIISVK